MPRIALSVICFLGSMKASACNLIVLMSWCVCTVYAHYTACRSTTGAQPKLYNDTRYHYTNSSKKLLTYLYRAVVLESGAVTSNGMGIMCPLWLE